MRRRYRLRENLISAAIGVGIGLPISLAAAREWSKTPEILLKTQAVTPIEAEAATLWEPIPLEPIEAETEPEPEYTDAELQLAARVIEAEAGNQGLTGKELVADTILNRIDDDRFPDTIEGVVLQEYQYAAPAPEYSEESLRAVKEEIEHRINDEILFFRTDHYHEFGTPVMKYRDHYFSK